MAKVVCPKCGETNKDLATKCFKCGTSLRRDKIKNYVERKHSDRLNYTKKNKSPSTKPVPAPAGGSFNMLGKLTLVFVLLILLGAGGLIAALYFRLIPIPV